MFFLDFFKTIWISGVFSSYYILPLYSLLLFSYVYDGCQVQSFFAAVKALSRKEVHYGAYATSEQVHLIYSWHCPINL